MFSILVWDTCPQEEEFEEVTILGGVTAHSLPFWKKGIERLADNLQFERLRSPVGRS
jgi:hypothetical protein